MGANGVEAGGGVGLCSGLLGAPWAVQRAEKRGASAWLAIVKDAVGGRPPERCGRGAEQDAEARTLASGHAFQ